MDSNVIAQQAATEFAKWVMDRSKTSTMIHYDIARYGMDHVYKHFLKFGASDMLKLLLAKTTP